MSNLREKLPPLLHGGVLTILFTLSSFLLPVLAALIFILNFHMHYSLKAQFSDNQHVIHSREILPSGPRYSGDKFRFEPDFNRIEHPNTIAFVALISGLWALDSFVVARGNLGARRDVVDKLLHEPLTKSPEIMIMSLVQVFLMCMPFHRLEGGFKGCTFSRNDGDVQIFKCPVENAACTVLPYFKIQRWWVGSVCWEARIARYCLLIMFVCSAILLRVYGPYELKRRNTMRFYLISTTETENLKKKDLEIGEPVGEKSVEDEQASAAPVDEQAH